MEFGICNYLSLTMEYFEIGIVGGGAAGLMAAIAAVEHGCKNVILFESNIRCGTKILMSGGSRCNVTNNAVNQKDFFGGNKNVIKNILQAFTEKDTIEFFNGLGVKLKKEEEGKYFPIDDKASTVLNALLKRCNELDVKISYQAKIISIEKNNEKFLLKANNHSFICNKVILTTGGKSYPSTGSDGTGYIIAASMGHSIINPLPALTPILLNEPKLSGLSGITLPTTLYIYHYDKKILSITGSTLITHFGLSGPCALNISREVARLKEISLRINFLPELNYDRLAELLKQSRNSSPYKSVFSLFRELLPSKLNKFIFDRAGIPSDINFYALKKEQLKLLCKSYTDCILNCQGVRGFNQAEVTAGGVPLEEINYQTMESKKQKGLYLAGEILDADGLIGGYNFQWAWSTGFIAGKSAAGLFNDQI